MNPNPSSVETKHQFGVTLFSKKLSGFTEHREALADRILKEMVRMPENMSEGKSTRAGWHSENNLHHWEDASVRWLMREIGSFSRECLIDPANKTATIGEILLDSAWANVNGQGAWNAPHGHWHTAWSGVVFVKTEEAADARTRSGNLEFLNPLPLGAMSNPASSISFFPRDGYILLFPGYILHWVHPNYTQNLRISIAFNLSVIPKRRRPTAVNPISIWIGSSEDNSGSK